MTRIVVAAVALCISWASLAPPAVAQRTPPSRGDYRHVVLVSWDGVRRDVLHELLDVADPTAPCWTGGTVYPMGTGRLNERGEHVYTCLPTLAGLKPADAPWDSPTYGAFQIIASHVTDDGATFTLPQHTSMLSGCDTEVHGITTNVSRARMPQGLTIYERLMDAFDPVIRGRRDGYVFRTAHHADRRFVGDTIFGWAKLTGALQIATGRGSEEGDGLGALRHAARSLQQWKLETEFRRLPDPAFFMFLHFKAPDWSAHIAGDRSRQYREAIVDTDARLYGLMEALREYGWSDAAILVTTDHGFSGIQHMRHEGRPVINTWIAARNVRLRTDHIPLRTPDDYCASQQDPDDCRANGPEIPMPAEDVVPDVHVTFVVPTILDMFGVDWRTMPEITGRSLYRP